MNELSYNNGIQFYWTAWVRNQENASSAICGCFISTIRNSFN